MFIDSAARAAANPYALSALTPMLISSSAILLFDPVNFLTLIVNVLSS